MAIKFYCNPTMIVGLHMVYDCFHARVAELNSYNREWRTFYRKSLLIPGLTQRFSNDPWWNDRCFLPLTCLRSTLLQNTRHTKYEPKCFIWFSETIIKSLHQTAWEFLNTDSQSLYVTHVQTENSALAHGPHFGKPWLNGYWGKTNVLNGFTISNILLSFDLEYLLFFFVYLLGCR